jgi:hypothetical protein
MPAGATSSGPRWPAPTALRPTGNGCGRGSLYSYSIVHKAPAPGFVVPLVLAVVELEEGPFMFSNVVGCAHAEVHIGMHLQVQFDEVAPGIHLPRFHPSKA